MIDDMVITGAACFDATGSTPAALKGYLKQQYGLDGRRLSRLSMLALAGGLLPVVRPATANTALYLASAYSSPSVLADMLQQVFVHQAAKPFDFLANLHNAPVFHLAAALGCHGASVFQVVGADSESWLQPLLLACLDLAAGSCDNALVGWVHEAQAARPGAEGSVWLCLQRPVATTEGARLHWQPAGQEPAAVVAVADSAFAAAAHWLQTWPQPADCMLPAPHGLSLRIGGSQWPWQRAGLGG